MIEDENKIDCIDSLVFGLNRTAEWRKKMAIRYPSDPPNARAAECLSRFAIEAAGLSDDAWLKVQPLYGGRAKQAMAGSDQSSGAGPGFQPKIKDLQSFVDHLMTCCRS
jgi:hypothetical protein